MEEPRMNEPRINEGKLHEKDWEDELANGIKGIRADMKDKMKSFPTPEFRAHMRAARREMLLAFRSILDKAIEKTEEKPEEPKAGRIIIE